MLDTDGLSIAVCSVIAVRWVVLTLALMFALGIYFFTHSPQHVLYLVHVDSNALRHGHFAAIHHVTAFMGAIWPSAHIATTAFFCMMFVVFGITNQPMLFMKSGVGYLLSDSASMPPAR